MKKDKEKKAYCGKCNSCIDLWDERPLVCAKCSEQECKRCGCRVLQYGACPHCSIVEERKIRRENQLDDRHYEIRKQLAEIQDKIGSLGTFMIIIIIVFGILCVLLSRNP